MPQLNPAWFVSQLFWLAVAFGLLYIILAKFTLPPLMDIMAKRVAVREGDLTAAQRFKAEAEEARKQYEETLAEARSRTQALMNEAEEAQKARAEEATRALDAQMAHKTAEAEKSIAQQKWKLIETLTPTAAALAGDIVEKLTKRAPGNDAVSKALSSLAKGNG